MRNKKNQILALILSLVTVFSTAFTSMAAIPAVTAGPIPAAGIDSNQTALPEEPVSVIVDASDSIVNPDAVEIPSLEVKEVVEDGTAETEDEPGGETGERLLGAAEPICWWIIENEESSDTCTLHISAEEAPEDIEEDRKGTYDQNPEYEVVEKRETAAPFSVLQGESRFIKSDESGELEPDIITEVSIDSPIAPAVVSSMFFNFQSLEEIKGLDNLDTSNVTDMSYMFNFCSKLTSLDLSGFHTSNAEDMSCMFWDCNELKDLDLNGFDTSNVKNMLYMFGECWALTELDLSGFDTKSVENTADMFLNCGDLTTIYVSEAFDLSRVANSDSGTAPDDIDGSLRDKGSKNMFVHCESLKGGAGTEWADTNPTDKTYACIDDPDHGSPGYFTGLKEISVPAGLPGVTYVVKDETDPSKPVTLSPKSTGEGTSAYIVKYGSKITITAVPAEGYTVVGTNPYVIEKVAKDTTVNSKELPKVEKIRPVTYTVTFDTDGGSAIEPLKVAAGRTAKEPAAPVKENCMFAGWFDEKDKEWDFAGRKITADVTIYAHWNRKSDPKPVPTPVHNDTKTEHTALFTGTWNNPVKNGTWTRDQNGVWHYTSSEIFRNTWGYILNPFAKEGQNSADWFWFDRQGNMLTGWQFINGKWYYLNPTKDGTLGACQLGGVTPDGWTVDENGAWIESIPKK